MQPITLIIFYSVLIVAGSLFGGWLPTFFRLTHVGMQVVLSLVGGLMLGVGLLHMLPHSYVELGSLDATLMWVLIGLLGMFFLIRTFHFHQHGPAQPEGECEHPDHDHHHHHHHGHGAPHSLSWVGVTFGLAVHTLMDGVALGAAVIADWGHGSEGMAAGFGVFMAVLLHKPLDALSITTLMRASGWTERAQLLVNAGFAMMCPIGAVAFALGISQFGEQQNQAVGIALALSAGTFLCISLSDLLPEVQFHQHDRFKLSAALLIGVFCAYGIRFLESPDAHQFHNHGQHQQSQEEEVLSPERTE